MNETIEFYKKYIGQRIANGPSPFGNWLNGKILKVEEDSLAIEFEVRENMVNPVKMLHGGIIAAMMDEIIGMTIFASGEKNFFFSLNLHVDFFSNVRVGTNVVVTTKLIKKNARMIQAECVITGPEDKLIAKGSTNLIST